MSKLNGCGLFLIGGLSPLSLRLRLPFCLFYEPNIIACACYLLAYTTDKTFHSASTSSSAPQIEPNNAQDRLNVHDRLRSYSGDGTTYQTVEETGGTGELPHRTVSPNHEQSPDSYSMAGDSQRMPHSSTTTALPSPLHDSSYGQLHETQDDGLSDPASSSLDALLNGQDASAGPWKDCFGINQTDMELLNGTPPFPHL